MTTTVAVTTSQISTYAMQRAQSSDGRSAAQIQAEEDAINAVRLHGAQVVAAIHGGEGRVIPPEGIAINDIPALAVPGAARDQAIAHMAHVTGRSISDLTADADKGILKISAIIWDKRSWGGDAPQISPQGQAAYQSLTGSANARSQELTGVNIDYIKQHVDQLFEGGAGHYADFLTSEAERYKAQGTPYTFTGAWGNDRVTHDVNEYVGWLYQAVGRQAQIKAQINS